MTDPIFREAGRHPVREQALARSSPPSHRTRGERKPAPLDTPEARTHLRESEELVEALKDLGVEAEKVAPTRDGRGHVRIDFDSMWQLVELAEKGITE